MPEACVGFAVFVLARAEPSPNVSATRAASSSIVCVMPFMLSMFHPEHTRGPERADYWDLLSGFFGSEFVVALNFDTQPHCCPGEPHEMGPLHCPDMSSCLQSSVPAHLHVPPGQGRSANAGVAPRGSSKTIIAANVRTWRMKRPRSNSHQAMMDGYGMTSAS